MPNVYDGQDLFPNSPPLGNLSYSTGSSHERKDCIAERQPDGSSRQPIRWPAVPVARDSDPCGPSVALHLVLGADGRPARCSAPASGSESGSHRERLARSVWQANRHAMEALSDIPQWLGTSPASLTFHRAELLSEDLVAEEDLPLLYGIEVNQLPPGPNFMRPRSSGARYSDPRHLGISCSSESTTAGASASPVKTMNAAVLHFPIGFHSAFPASPIPAIHLSDQVLPFRAPARQTTAVFSLVGGTGATSIAAGLARIAAGSGIRVLLADTCAHSLLSRLFGARDLKQGVVRNFFPASGERNRMISLVNLAVDAFPGDDCEQYRMLDDFQQDAARMDRIIWDLSGAPLDWAAKVLRSSPQILIPLLPNANSMVQLRATERFLNRCHDEDPSANLRYVLNHFDESDPLHVDMRGRFRELLGNQMLQVTLRRSPLVDEALSRGKTIVDHAPASPLVSDLWRLAQQLRQVDAPPGSGPLLSTPSEWFEQ